MRYTYRHVRLIWRDLCSVAMMYIPSIVKIGSGIQKLATRGYRDTQIRWILHKPTLGKEAKNETHIRKKEANIERKTR
jgi:hypothetical protein